ncbi:MAG: GntR family transcriptional regulator [Lentisphaeria bacterium]|nr:GntR family transcriptional regulator [Lentisphaeria bacterium]
MNRVGGKNDIFREHILSEIAIGVYRGGQKLPAERELGERYRVSRNTIRRALSELERLGVLERRPPVGTFVTADALEKAARRREAAPELLVKFVIAPEQVANPQLQQLFHSCRRHLPESVGVSVLFSTLTGAGAAAECRSDIAVVFGNYSDEQLSEVKLQARELVLLGHTHPCYNYLDSDNYAGGRAMAEYAIRSGHTRLGAIGPRGQDESSDFARRLAGIRDAAAEAGAELQVHRMELDEARNMGPSCDRILDEFRRRDPGISLILALYDQAALTVIDYCRRRGLRIPQDMSVIGYDDQCYVEFLDPPLTTVKGFGEAIGARLARFVRAVMDGAGEGASIREMIPPLLIARGTVECRNPAR